MSKLRPRKVKRQSWGSKGGHRTLNHHAMLSRNLILISFCGHCYRQLLGLHRCSSLVQVSQAHGVAGRKEIFLPSKAGKAKARPGQPQSRALKPGPSCPLVPSPLSRGLAVPGAGPSPAGQGGASPREGQALKNKPPPSASSACPAPLGASVAKLPSPDPGWACQDIQPQKCEAPSPAPSSSFLS